jgi:SAM-dependent methyltransferase
MSDDRLRLRTTFDSASELYQQARPEYPEQLYDDLVEATEITAGDNLLEVGCATGKATIPLARRGFRVTCIEIGAELAAAARGNLAGFPDVEIVDAEFESWRPPDGVRFDLIYAATAWHWIDPAVRYAHAWELLRPGGHLAFWGAAQVVPEGGDTFFAELQDVYDEIGEGLPEDATWPRPGELPDSLGEIERSGLFEAVALNHYDWEIVYDAEEYVRLLDTFSGHISMESWKRERLYGEIRRRLAERPEGRLRRHWGAVLHVARRRDDPVRHGDPSSPRDHSS